MSLINRHLYEFGEFRLETKEKMLIRSDRPVTLTPKCFHLLSVLVENHGRLLTKDELMKKIWADSFVEESNLTFNIRHLRKILGDGAQNPVYIKTVRQHGYRFIAPVTEIAKKTPAVLVEESAPPQLDQELTFSETAPAERIKETPGTFFEIPRKLEPRAHSKPYLLIAATAILLTASFTIAFILNKTASYIRKI